MKLLDYVGQPCKSQLAFEFFPKKKQKLALKKIASIFREKGFAIDLETHFFIGVIVEKTSVSVFQDGKIMVKDTKEKGFATKIAKKVVKVIN